MVSISIRVDESLLASLDANAHKLHVSRTHYIREAIQAYNAQVRAQSRRKKLIQASQKVRHESLSVNKEFSEIEHNPEL